MKRVLQHPPADLTGKQYWRSVGELSDTPEFRGWLEREFPAGAAEHEGDEVSRRRTLNQTGESMALAGCGPSRRRNAATAARHISGARGRGGAEGTRVGHEGRARRDQLRRQQARPLPRHRDAAGARALLGGDRAED